MVLAFVFLKLKEKKNTVAIKVPFFFHAVRGEGTGCIYPSTGVARQEASAEGQVSLASS